MFEAILSATDQLWRNGLAVVPLVMLVALLIRLVPCRPATRHLLWVMVLAWLVLPPLVPAVDWSPGLRIGDAAGTVSYHASVRDDGHKSSDDAPPSTVKKDHLAPPRKRSLDAVRPSHGEVAKRSRDLPMSESPLLLYVDRAGDARFVTDSEDRSVACSVERTPKTLARASAPDRPLPNPDWTLALETTMARAHPSRPKHRPAPPPKPKADRRSIATEGPSADAVREVDTADANASDTSEQAEPIDASSRAADVSSVPRYAFHYDAETEPALRHAIEPSVAAESGPRDASHRGQPEDATGALARTSTGEASSGVTGRDATWSAWQSWLEALAGLRDAFVRIPPVPASLWIGGVMVLATMGLLRLVAFGVRLRRAEPADRAVRRIVRRASRRLGLRRAPEVLIVEDRVSPMICCGLWPRLILPRTLWEELDDAGRHAVVCHELAHLRRRDHLTSWLETAVGALYWWHPLVWWVRGRLHAEAEHCCDAWVTHLLPKERRAYAQVLLRTRAYLSREGDPAPAMTIGMTSGRAKRFARRLTMVMTNRVKPGLSSSGIALVLAVAVVGWLTSPAESCPNEKKKEELIKSKSTFEQHLAAKAKGRAILVSDDDDDDLDDLEDRMDRLEAKLNKLLDKLDRTGDRNVRRRAERQERKERRERRVRSQRQRAPEHSHGHVRMRPHPPKPAKPPKPRRPSLLIESGKKEWRDYTLSKGKLKAFTKLMVRDDVPIYVRPGDDSIGIQATPKQHKVFKAFFQMIDPSDTRADALKHLFAPAPPAPSVAHYTAVGSAPAAPCAEAKPCGNCAHHDCAATSCDENCEHRERAAKFKATVEVRAEAARAREAARRELARVRTEVGGETAVIREKARAQAREIREQLRGQIREARTEAESHNEMLESLNQQIDQLHDQAEEFREKAEELREKGDELRERVSADGNDDARLAFEQHVSTMETGADGLEHDADELEEHADMLEEKTEAIEEEIESLQEFVEELHERVSSVDEVQHLIDEGAEGNVRLARSMAALAGGLHTEPCPPRGGVVSSGTIEIEPVEPAAFIDSIEAARAAGAEAALVEPLRPVEPTVPSEVAEAIKASLAAVEEAESDQD